MYRNNFRHAIINQACRYFPLLHEFTKVAIYKNSEPCIHSFSISLIYIFLLFFLICSKTPNPFTTLIRYPITTK